MDDSNIIDISRGRKTTIIPPKLITRKKTIDNIEPFVDPGIEELLNFPMRIPSLKREIKKELKEENLIEREINLLQKYRQKPLLFWKNELGIPIDIWKDDKPPRDWEPGDPVPLWSKQREIINAMVDYRRVAVKSGHGVGKTFLAGGIALYLGLVWHATGMTTAPTFRQVRRALWGEIHYLYNKAVNPIGGKLNQVSLDLGDKWFIEGFATDKPTDNITGIHEENIFVIVDEAGGVLPETFEALDALLTSENVFVLYIGNPVSAAGPFYDAFKPGSGFKTFTISCYDCPNVKHGYTIYPKLTTKRWVDDKEKKWGMNSSLFMIRVKGEFANEASDTLIPIRYLDMALRKGLEGEVKPDVVKGFGADVARQGTDSSVLGARYEDMNRPESLFKILDVTSKKRETETAGRIKRIYDECVKGFKLRILKKIDSVIRPNKEEENEDEEGKLPPINVDEINVGGGVIDILIEDEYPVNAINVSEKPDQFDIEASKIFLNKRAQYYWKLKKLFEDELVAVEDEDIVYELSKFKFFILSSGKVKILEKDLIKKELNGKSPDKAECMMLAYAEDESSVDKDLIRFI